MEQMALPHTIQNDCGMKNHKVHCLELGERDTKDKGIKRKAVCSVDLAPEKEYEDRWIEEELNDTLCILKSKLSMSRKRKGKLPEVVPIKSEETSSELGWIANRDTCLPDEVKVVDSEDCCNGPSKPSVSCDEEVQRLDRLNKFQSVAGREEKLIFEKHVKVETLTDKVGSPGATNDKHECEFKGNRITISLRCINAHNKKPRKYRFKSSTQSCLQSVIKYSQHQMRVMSFLTRKVMQEMESMKDIVEGSLDSESTNNVTSSKFDMDEVKTAIQRASESKNSTELRISKMQRDCNRFCKILEKLHEGDEISERRRAKKVKFADEHGDVLSDVRIFERDETLE